MKDRMRWVVAAGALTLASSACGGGEKTPITSIDCSTPDLPNPAHIFLPAGQELKILNRTLIGGSNNTVGERIPMVGGNLLTHFTEAVYGGDRVGFRIRQMRGKENAEVVAQKFSVLNLKGSLLTIYMKCYSPTKN